MFDELLQVLTGQQAPFPFRTELGSSSVGFFYVSDPMALPVSDHICVSAFSGAAVEMDRIRGTPNVVRQTLLLSGLPAPGCAGRGKGCAPSPASGCRLSVLQLGSRLLPASGRDAEGSAAGRKSRAAILCHCHRETLGRGIGVGRVNFPSVLLPPSQPR